MTGTPSSGIPNKANNNVSTTLYRKMPRREEDIATVPVEAVYGIPLQSCVWTAFPPSITGVPVPLRRCHPTYRLVKCRHRGCNTLLPDDLTWCYFHQPVNNIAY
jgi:hypothetical protein